MRRVFECVLSDTGVKRKFVNSSDYRQKDVFSVILTEKLNMFTKVTIAERFKRPWSNTETTLFQKNNDFKKKQLIVLFFILLTPINYAFSF